MAFLIPTNSVQIARFANGLYGLQLGFASTNGIVSDVASGGLLPTFNNYYTLSFGSQTTASVAQQIITNLGIVAGQNGLTASAVSAALAYVTGQLNSALPAARGAAVKGILDLWSSISADPVNGAVYGTAATAWNTTISAAVQYAGAVNPDVTVAQAAAINAARLAQPVSYTAVTGADSYLGGTASPNSVSAVANGTTATFTSGDSFTGGAGVLNSINVSDSTTQAATATTWTPTGTGGITVNGFQTATFTSNNSIVSNTTATGGTQGWSGLTSLTVNDNAANGASTTITAAPTTNVILNEQNAGAAGAVTTIAGGKDVTLTITGNTGSTTTIGGTTALLQPTGAISVANTVPSVQPTAAAPTVAIAATGGAITIQGGTTIGVTQTLTPPAVLPTTSNVATTAGAVTITGTANTTAVTVTQTKAAGYTATVNYGGMVATGSNNPTLTITNPQGTATLVITGLSPANGGSPTGYTAAQVAAIANMSNTIGTALSPIPGLSSVLTLTGTATSYGYSTGAAGPAGSTITYTGSPTGGSASSAILAANFTAANGTTNAQVAAATGNIYDGNVVINDINANSSANGVIKSVVIDGLSANNAAAGSAVINANSMTHMY